MHLNGNLACLSIANSEMYRNLLAVMGKWYAVILEESVDKAIDNRKGKQFSCLLYDAVNFNLKMEELKNLRETFPGFPIGIICSTIDCGEENKIADFFIQKENLESLLQYILTAEIKYYQKFPVSLLGIE